MSLGTLVESKRFEVDEKLFFFFAFRLERGNLEVGDNEGRE